MKTILPLTYLLFITAIGNAQDYYQQYFDGNDTVAAYSIFPEISNDSNNVWQIGSPQKTIFNTAATVPNAIITDTINSYPINNLSEFTISLPISNFFAGILAMRWRQKLDLDSVKDFGKIEISSDNGAIWENTFDNPYIYNFYGYNSVNVDYDSLGNAGFTGTDSTWKDIWFCIDQFYYSSLNDTIFLKFTLESDSINNNSEGWMMDNFIFEETIVHTINENDIDQMLIYPTIVTDKINFISKKTDEFNIIESIELYSMDGKIIRKWGKSPTKFQIDIVDIPHGAYIIKVTTTLFEKTFKILKE